MKFILINRKDLTVAISETISKDKFVIPAELRAVFRDLSPLEDLVYHGILYPAKMAEDRRRHPEYEEQGINIGYKLIEPDPWLVAIAFVMWQGIIQGLAWDSVKVLVQLALKKLEFFKLAPPISMSIQKVFKQDQFGFSWTQYGTDGKKQHEMFIGIKTKYEKMSQKERCAISNSVIKARPK